MIQWILQVDATLWQLVDPDGSVVASGAVAGQMNALTTHLQDGDQISVEAIPR